MCSALPPRGGGDGVPYLILFQFLRRYQELFFPQGGTTEVWWNTWDTLKNHNFRKKEHNISYVDTKYEISLTMFIDSFLFSPSIWRPWSFLPWSPNLILKLHGAPLVMLTFLYFFSCLHAWRPSRHVAPSCHVDFSLTFLHSNSDCHMCSAPARGGGWWGSIFTSFPIFQDDITSSFSHKVALLRCGGIHGTR